MHETRNGAQSIHVKNISFPGPQKSWHSHHSLSSVLRCYCLEIKKIIIFSVYDTSQNIKARNKYVSILRDEWEERNLLERAQELTKLRTEKVENETIIHLTQELDRDYY